MIHIVFSEANKTLIEEMQALDDSLLGKIVAFNDDLSIGPIADLHTDEGNRERMAWHAEKLTDTGYEEKKEQTEEGDTIEKIKQCLDEDSEQRVCFWIAQNAQDIVGYYRYMGELKEYESRVEMVFLNNLPFISEKGGLFYPTHLAELPAKELYKARKVTRTLTAADFELDAEEWRRMMAENAPVRKLEGAKKIVAAKENILDSEIMNNLSAQWQKSWRVVSNCIHRIKPKMSDVFYYWRLKTFVESGLITSNNQTEGIRKKEIEIKLISNADALM